MSNHEIEDVLSSIRRLVSDDLRPTGKADGGRAAHGKAAKPADKLLLTPALRVVARAEDRVADVVPELDRATAATPLAEAGVMQPPLADAAMSEPAASDLSARDVGEVVTRLGSGVAEDDWESPTGDDENWSDSGWAAPADTAFEAEDAAAPGPAFVHRGRGDAPAAAFADVEDRLPEVEAEDQGPQFAAPPPYRRAAADAAPLSDDDWADQAEAAVMAELADEVLGAAGLDGDDRPEMTFDETVLRDLVRDLIREELAGSLGERITRNVRKLVRAEVARALVLHQIE